MGFLDDLSQGLRGAAGVLNPTIQAQNAQQDFYTRQQQDAQRQAMIEQTIRGIENGSIDAGQGQAILERLGYGGGQVGLSQATKSGMALEEDRKLQAIKTQRLEQQQAAAEERAGLLRQGLGGVDVLRQSIGVKVPDATGKLLPITEEQVQTAGRDLVSRFGDTKLLEKQAEQYTPQTPQQKEALDARRSAQESLNESRRLNANLAAMRIENQKQHNADMAAGRDAKIVAKEEAAKKVTENLVSQIDEAIKLATDNPSVVGGMGVVSRAGEFVISTLTGGGETPASKFQQQIRQLQSDYRSGKKGGMRLKSDEVKMDQIVSGLGLGTSQTQAVNNLKQLKANLLRSSGLQDTSPIDDGMPLDNIKSPVTSIKKINSDADYNALPSGSEFIAPDGSHRRKP